MDFSLLDYTLFSIKGVGFGLGFILFAIISFLACLSDSYSSKPTDIIHEENSIFTLLINIIVSIVMALIGSLGYVLLKFIGFGVWQLMVIFWDCFLFPVLTVIGDIIDAVYSYESK